MIVRHLVDGRTVADTAALAALTARPAHTVRKHCDRSADGYDVAQCIAALDGQPDPIVYPGSRLAAAAVGVSDGTVRSWAGRRKLRHLGRDPSGRPLYDLDDLQRLAGGA